MYVHCAYTVHMAQTKDHRLNLRVAAVDADLFREAAEMRHESLSQFMVEGARERAERLLADRRRFVIDDDAWASFTAALDRPAETNAAVVDLFRRPRPE